jgi:hypothetical protein
MKESKSLSGFEPTVVRGKWFEVNDLNHSATDAPSTKDKNIHASAKPSEHNKSFNMEY